MALDKFVDLADPLWEQRVRGLENGEQIGSEAITAAKIASSAVTEAKIASGAVAQAKAAKATIPATGAAEGEFKLGAGGVARTLIVNLQAKAEAGPYTLKHLQNTEMFILSAYNKTKKASSTITWKIVSAEEIELTLGTAPAAKDEVLVEMLY